MYTLSSQKIENRIVLKLFDMRINRDLTGVYNCVIMLYIKLDSISLGNGGSMMIIKESAENYLEAILMIKQKKGYVRSIDIANLLNFTKPSVSVAMKSFREEKYITVDGDGNINLTDKGMEIAAKVYERHEIIAMALMALGVEENIAYEDSCKIEHDISDQTFLKIKQHLKKHNILK